jgi:hypothetical protein
MTARHWLGVRLHPEAVTAAWYAQDCPPGLFDASDLPLRTRLRWRLVLWLRGARP